MKKIEKIGDYNIRKSEFWGDKIVYPIRNENGKINKFNLLTGGAWGKLIITVVVVLLILSMCLFYYRDVKVLTDFQKNICDYLPDITEHCLFNKEKESFFPSNILIDTSGG
jgi:hypothetical protein